MDLRTGEFVSFFLLIFLTLLKSFISVIAIILLIIKCVIHKMYLLNKRGSNSAFECFKVFLTLEKNVGNESENNLLN